MPSFSAPLVELSETELKRRLLRSDYFCGPVGERMKHGSPAVQVFLRRARTGDFAAMLADLESGATLTAFAAAEILAGWDDRPLVCDYEVEWKHLLGELVRRSSCSG